MLQVEHSENSGELLQTQASTLHEHHQVSDMMLVADTKSEDGLRDRTPFIDSTLPAYMGAMRIVKPEHSRPPSF